MTNRGRHSSKHSRQGVPLWDALLIKCEHQAEVTCSELASQSQQQEQPRRHLEKLRSKIVSRRRAAGQGDVQRDPEPVKHQMTAEEMDKRERRKEQNRRAARKCREKKKAVQGSFAEELARVHSENEQLEGEVTRLRHEKDTLTKILQAHVQGGGCSHFTAPITQSVSASGPPGEVPFSAADVGKDKMDDYLLGLSPLEPSETFMDLEQIIGQDSALTHSKHSPAAGLQGDERDLKEMTVDGLSASLLEDTFVSCPDRKLMNYPSPLPSRDRYSVSSVASNMSELSSGFAVCDQTISLAPFESGSQSEGAFPCSPARTSSTCFHQDAAGRDGPWPAAHPHRTGSDGIYLDPTRTGQGHRDQFGGHLGFYAAVMDSTDGEEDDVFDVSCTITDDGVYKQYSSDLGDGL